MSCAHIMHGAFSGRFTDHTIFICKLNRRVLFIHETFLVYKLETFKSCKEAKHIIKKKLYGALFYGWGSTASRPAPLRGGSLLFSTKSPEIPGTRFIDLGRMKG